jgi:hypothetical protein
LVTVPASWPEPVIAARTAAWASMKPWPEVLSSTAVPSSRAVSMRIVLIMSTSISGFACRMRAIVPATCGPAIDVPSQPLCSKPPPGTEE